MTTSDLREAATEAPLHSQQTQTATLSTRGSTGGNLPTKLRSTSAMRQVESQKTHLNSTSDKATAAFVRRTLCSHNVLLGNGERGRTTPQPIEEVLPPLTSSNEVDLQLYGIISVIIKEFVQTWYSKITPDHVFVNEVLQTIAHCTRALEQRLRRTDLESLLLDEIPELLETHVRTFRQARQQACSPNSLVSDPRLIYHAHHPHPALSPVPTESVPSSIVEQRESESAWRQLLVQGVLVVLLPTEDLGNGCLRALVAEIFAEMIIGNGISGKACEGWVLWEGITSIAKVLQDDGAKEQQSPTAAQEQSMTRLERFGLLSQAKDEPSDTTRRQSSDRHYHQTFFRTFMVVFWALIQFAFMAFTAVRAAIKNIATSSSLPMRSHNSEPPLVDHIHQSQDVHADAALSRRPFDIKRPIVSMNLWSCIAHVIELDTRMPWLSGSLSMLHRGLLVGPGKVGCTDQILDRFLSHAVHKRILNPAFLPFVLRTIRATLFPNNGLGPTRQPPSADEAKAIKLRCAASLLDLLPPMLASTFFSTQSRSRQLDEIADILSCLQDPYLNKHMIFQIVELIVLRLVPELGEQGVRAMIEDRLG